MLGVGIDWAPQGEEAAELRAIARDAERATRDERRCLNRLRADLIATFPAALPIAGHDVGRPVFPPMLERWPTSEDLSAVSRDELIAFAGKAGHGWLEQFADKVGQALGGNYFTLRDHLVRAKADAIRRAAVQPLA